MRVLCTNAYEQTSKDTTKRCSVFQPTFFLLHLVLLLYHHFRLAALAPMGVRILEVVCCLVIGYLALDFAIRWVVMWYHF